MSPVMAVRLPGRRTRDRPKPKTMTKMREPEVAAALDFSLLKPSWFCLSFLSYPSWVLQLHPRSSADSPKRLKSKNQQVQRVQGKIESTNKRFILCMVLTAKNEVECISSSRSSNHVATG